jgi:general secretion pathway protein G
MRRKKRALTLLEIMIVIALITLITGVIGYNMSGTLDRGRAFRTEQAKAQLYDMLTLSASDGHTISNILKHPQKYIEKLGFAKKPDQLLVDGWGQKFLIIYNVDQAEFEITSDKYNKYLDKKK